MKGRYGSVAFVTGASSGIGMAIAKLLMEKGYRVYGTSRKQQTEDNVRKASAGGGFIKMICMDVCSEESVKNAVEHIVGEEGGIDILINNAGMGIAGSIEDTSPEEAFKQIDTNFFGMHRTIRQVLPIMRKKGSGLILNISSVAAVFPITYQAMYVASKAAIEAMSGVLRNELRPFGIKVACVQPGDTKTGFTGSRVVVSEADDSSPYKNYFKKSLDVMIKDETNGPGPEVVAKVVYSVICRKNPPVVKAVGLKYKAFIFVKRLVPKSFESFILSKMY